MADYIILPKAMRHDFFAEVLSSSPTMQPLRIAADAHRRAEELAEARLGKEFIARAVGHDAAIAHEDEAGDLGEYVAEVMRDHDQPRAFASQPAQSFAQFALRGKIERVG